MAETEAANHQEINVSENKEDAKMEDPDGNQHGRPEGQHIQSAVLSRRDQKSKSVIKQGHLRVKEDGQMVYKKTTSQAIMSATQLGIGYSVGRLGGKQERDILMVDFFYTEKVWFPSSGSKETPSHKFDDFRFKSYSPVAFRYFREIFGILPQDFLISLSNEPIREISNPGASGSLFFVSNDDNFIVKTVQHKEATFLQQLLQGYYMNLHQNPRTLLPKFFGLYCYQSGSINIRLTVMNNLLPTKWKCHMKFDLKGSTYKRKANKEEQEKKSPTLKDLDYLDKFPEGILLDAETYDAVIKTIGRDVRFLESFKIMDYSFLLGIHNVDLAKKNENEETSSPKETLQKSDSTQRKNIGAALEAIQISKNNADDAIPVGGIPAKTVKGERLILFIGIIDILQSYRLAKKMEHGWKSMLTDGNTVSVHKPSYYAKRFLNFIKDKVFTRVAVQRGLSKKRSLRHQQYAIDKDVGEIPKSSTGQSSGSHSAEIHHSASHESTEKPRTKVVTIVEPSEVKNPGDNEAESEDRENENEKENKAEKNENKKEDIQLDDMDISYVNETENVNNVTNTLEIVTSKKESDNEPASLSDSENTEKNSTKYIVGETINFNINSGSTTATQDNNSSSISSSPPTQDSFL